MTNTETRDIAVGYLKQTTVGWNKVSGYSPSKLLTTNWGKAMTALAKITDGYGSGSYGR